MSALATIARALGGEVAGDHVRAPGPGHSKKDDSLSIHVDPTAPSGVRVHSFAGDDWRNCLDYVKGRLGITDTAAPRSFTRQAERPAPDDGERIARAMTIWNQAGELRNTAGWKHLASRGVDLAQMPPDLHDALRWHPACPWEKGRHGCMVALFTDAISGEPKAIHRTAVTPAGEKIGRKALGPTGGCVIRLWPDEDVTEGLVCGEGIETTLAAATRIEHLGTLLQPAWATASAGNMAKLPVLGGIEALTLLVDNDANEAGQRAAMECSARWTAARREVIRLVPRQPGADFNNLVEVS
jgi:hypothetical protein